MYKKSVFKRVIKSGLPGLLIFLQKRGEKMPSKSNNTGGRGGARHAAGRKNLRSKRRPRTAIRTDADWRFWIFPKSRVSIYQIL